MLYGNKSVSYFLQNEPYLIAILDTFPWKNKFVCNDAERLNDVLLKR